MYLRGIANAVSSQINPNTVVSIQRSAGYGIGPDRRQIPNYEPAVTGPAQIQALDSEDLKQIDGLNLQGDIRALYLRGRLSAVIRPDSKGGDIVTIAAPAAPELIGTWLVVKPLETWSDWAKVAIQKQMPDA